MRAPFIDTAYCSWSLPASGALFLGLQAFQLRSQALVGDATRLSNATTRARAGTTASGEVSVLELSRGAVALLKAAVEAKADIE